MKTTLTIYQKKIIEKEYLNIPMKQLGKKLNVHVGKIKRYLKSKNLIIPENIKKERKKATQFKKNHKPHNKGLKIEDYMPKEQIEKIKKTQFKKGNKPHNTKYNGTIETRTHKNVPYKYIKIAENKWELYHRYLWEQHYGKIPKDKIIVFKDHDTTNITIDNLEMISKEENMLRNSRWDFPPEIIPSMALIKIMEKTIKNKENGKK